VNAVRDRPARRASGTRASAARRGRPSNTNRRRPHLRVVPERRPRRHRLAFLVAAFALTSALVVAVVSLQALVSQTAFRMETIQQQSEQLKLQFDQLRLELATASSPQHIEREARRLGLVYPAPDHVKTITVGGPSPSESQLGEHPSFEVKRIIGASP
jgi:cell division protein FtsL